jgi:hypothetical protein
MVLLPFFIKYLLLPLVALVLIVPAVLLKKKNAALDNKTLIIFSLTCALLAGIQGFWGIIGDIFSPYYYAFAQLVYIAGGILYVQSLGKYISPKLKSYQLLLEIIITIFVLILGMFVFSLIYNALSPIPNGFMASSCVVAFTLPLLFYWTFLAYINIPIDIFKIWRYNAASVNANRLDGVDFNKLLVLELEFGRKINDEDRMKVQVKALPDMYFGEWFGMFIENYNRKFPDNPIASENETGEAHSWIFYVKPSIFSRRKYIDPDLSVAANKIREKYTIITKRVTNDQV